jgi:hypothetical protein
MKMSPAWIVGQTRLRLKQILPQQQSSIDLNSQGPKIQQQSPETAKFNRLQLRNLARDHALCPGLFLWNQQVTTAASLTISIYRWYWT